MRALAPLEPWPWTFFLEWPLWWLFVSKQRYV